MNQEILNYFLKITPEHKEAKNQRRAKLFTSYKIGPKNGFKNPDRSGHVDVLSRSRAFSLACLFIKNLTFNLGPRFALRII